MQKGIDCSKSFAKELAATEDPSKLINSKINPFLM